MVKKPTKNIIFLSVVIVTIITIILLGTYALYTWASSENTELTTTIGNLATVHFDEGDNINVANIGPVFNYEQDGEITTFDVINLTSEELNLQVKINVTTITDNLKESTFKYTLLSSTDNTTFTKVTTGNFLNASNNNSITVASGITLPRKIYFKLIIYIDGNYENPISMQGGSLVGSISVETTLPADFTLKMPDTFSVGNSTIDTTCSDANVTFNPINMHYKVSSLTKSSGNLCTPTFTSTSRTKLNNHIISLAGTTQGTGQLVHEIDDCTVVEAAGTKLEDATRIDAPSDYLNYTEYSSTSNTSISGTTTTGIFTDSNNVWSTNTTNMTSGTYYHFSFNVPTEGYYQICYTLGTGNVNNRLYIYNGSTPVRINGSDYLSASSSSTKTGCVNIDKLLTSNKVRVVQRAYTSIASLSFKLGTLTATPTTYDTGYRYEGKDPNNYIYFNNELWRIIGVFDSTSHGVSNTNLVKIIRNDSIGGYAWNKSNPNNWPNSSLYHLLNDYYYTATDGTSSDYCYQYSSNKSIKGNCNYTKIGLQTDYRNMVQTNTTWYLGGPSSNSNPTSTFYANERDSSKIYSGRSPSTTGNIGLMYASDYGYSVLSSSCARTTNLGRYDTNTCAGNAWLKKETYEWTITHCSDRFNYVWRVTYKGDVYGNPVSYGYAFRPVLYLKSDVTVMGGDGSLASPYQIGI